MSQAARTRAERRPYGVAAFACRTVILLTALLAANVALAQPRPEDATAVLALLPHDASEHEREGAVLYHFHCAVCHGLTGRGFEEARLAFPSDHRHCSRCHRPTNPATMSLSSMRPDYAFSLGEAPALLGPEGTIDAWPSLAALAAYVRAAMPRPFPGSLSQAEADAISAFLLRADSQSAP